MNFILLFLAFFILIVRAFFPIPINFHINIINGINLIVDVLCGSFIVSIITYLITIVFPQCKRSKKVKDLVKYKLSQLDLLKWIPSDVNGRKKKHFRNS
ncbi:hypothetical protein Holit_00035 [Hollandina sp. SP2]